MALQVGSRTEFINGENVSSAVYEDEFRSWWGSLSGATDIEKWRSADATGSRNIAMSPVGGTLETAQALSSLGMLTKEMYDDPLVAETISAAEKSGFTQIGRLGFTIGAGIMLGGAAGAAIGAAGGAAGGTSAAVGGAEGTAIYSTPAVAGELVSTPALTTFAGPTGTSLLSTTVPTATLGIGEGLAAGLGGVEFAEGLDSGAAAMDLAAPSSRVAATSSAASGLSGSDLLLAASAVPQVMSMFAGAPEMEGAAAQDLGAGVSKPEPRNPSTENRDRAMELRRAAAERAANAAGAKRSGNEADLLGQTGRTTQRRRANTQRTVLGY